MAFFGVTLGDLSFAGKKLVASGQLTTGMESLMKGKKERVKCKSGDEWDAFYSKEYYFWKPGDRKRIKNRYNRRMRRRKIEAL